MNYKCRMRHRGCAKNLSRRVEDYLEAILNVTLEKGYARTKDVACELDLSPSSVVEMFRKLDGMGLVEYRRYEGVVLSAAGREVAEVIKFRHDTLKAFLMAIHVPKKIANADACYMEHELHRGLSTRSGSWSRRCNLTLQYLSVSGGTLPGGG